MPACLPIKCKRSDLRSPSWGHAGWILTTPPKSIHCKACPGSSAGYIYFASNMWHFKQIAPGKDIGFDLSAEYRTALSLFDKKAGGEK